MHQPGILAPLPDHGRYIELRLKPGHDPMPVLAGLHIDDGLVVGLGPGLAPRARAFKAQSGAGVQVPSTQSDLWLWVRGRDRGDIATRARRLKRELGADFEVVREVNGFKSGIDREIGRDLSGYEDGNENPAGANAVRAAFAPDGSSFVSVQQWVHDLDRFDGFSPELRDHIIGRRISDNAEIDDAPAFAHVKRTAQESFAPEAFILRRSMPWSESGAEGLVFVAFGHSFDAFETLLAHMVGADDAVVDGLFRFSHPVSGANFWCPPVVDQRLVLESETHG